MVKSNAGLRDWIIQRITAVIIGVYALLVMGFLIFTPHLDYRHFYAFFSHLSMKMATVVVVVSILWHAWVGLWTVFTDYVKPVIVRLILESAVIILLIAYVVWVIEIFWQTPRL